MNLILDESQAQVKAIHAQMDPQLEAVHANQITRMNLMLTPAQQAEYEKMRKERQEKEKEKQNQRRNGVRRRSWLLSASRAAAKADVAMRPATAESPGDSRGELGWPSALGFNERLLLRGDLRGFRFLGLLILLR